MKGQESRIRPESLSQALGACPRALAAFLNSAICFFDNLTHSVSCFASGNLGLPGPRFVFFMPEGYHARLTEIKNRALDSR